MSKQHLIQRILDPGMVAILRADSSAQLIAVCEALLRGGVTAIEVTMTTPGAIGVIAEVTQRFGDRILMGVGSVLDTETCRAAILAGAQFVVTPVLLPGVIRMCNRYARPVACGAYTPTEAFTAHEQGADFVKIFPADQLGTTYIRNILAPLPMLRIIPTGGVTVETAPGFIQAGCAALAAGSSLVGKEALRNGDWDGIARTASAFVEAIGNARREA